MDESDAVKILMVEDDPKDQRIMQRVLDDTQICEELVILEDGGEALDYLARTGEFDDRSGAQPELVLLDLNLPKVSGHEVLEKLRENKELQTIPVVVLTTSDAEEMVDRSYELGAQSHIVKPVNMEKFNDFVRTLEEYWFKIVSLPS